MPERLSAWEGRYHKVKIEYGQQIQEAFDLEDEGRKAEEPRNRAAWARMMAAETRKQAMDRSKNVKQSNGEAVPPSAEKFIHDVLTIPDLASVQASLDRNRLLLQSGTDVRPWHSMRPLHSGQQQPREDVGASIGCGA